MIMKRKPELLKLSREHHRALVLAKRAQRLAAGTPHVALTFMRELPELFAAELEPHLQVEEIGLLSALGEAAPGERRDEIVGMIERTCADHRQLRELARRVGGGEYGALGSFGDLLTAHVRFEERELFELAEAVLSPDALARVAAIIPDLSPTMSSAGQVLPS